MIKILDSTLREGEQTPGVCFDVHIKIAIADLLDEIGVDIIEAGHPMVTDSIRHAVTEISRRNLRAVVGAHARSLDEDVELAIACGVGFLGIFYCVSDERLTHFAKSLTQAVDQIARMIHLAKSRKPTLLVRYTPEDAVRSPFASVIAAASEAVRAGANIISIADTTGVMIPGTSNSMYDYVKRLKDELARLDLHPDIAVHCHNDRGLALANALDSFRAGADIIDVTALGLGERAGIVDMGSLLAVLASDFGAADRWNLPKIPELYDLVSRYARIPIPVNQPVTGKNAFTHCAGVHTQAAMKNPLHYQSLDPAIVGRKPEVCLDHMSGLSALRHSLDLIGEGDVDAELARRILRKVKEVGETGRTVDLAELRYIVRYVREHCCTAA